MECCKSFIVPVYLEIWQIYKTLNSTTLSIANKTIFHFRHSRYKILSLSSLSLSVNYEITIIYLPERSFFGKAYALVSTLPSVDLMGPLSHEITAHFHNLESPDPVAILMRFVDFERMDWFKYPGYRHKYVCNCCWYAPVT